MGLDHDGETGEEDDPRHQHLPQATSPTTNPEDTKRVVPRDQTPSSQQTSTDRPGRRQSDTPPADMEINKDSKGDRKLRETSRGRQGATALAEGANTIPCEDYLTEAPLATYPYQENPISLFKHNTKTYENHPVLRRPPRTPAVAWYPTQPDTEPATSSERKSA